MTEREISDFLKEQYSIYPKMLLQDFFKGLFQSVYGCEHLVSDEKQGLLKLREEAEGNVPIRENYIEPLGDIYCRAHLWAVKSGKLSAKTLFNLFFLSASPPSTDAREELKKGLKVLTDLSEGELPGLSRDDIIGKARQWEEQGFKPLHHSEEFREAYRPAYRVIKRSFVKYLPILEKMDKLLKTKEKLTVAIEGGSATGKSTLGEALAKLYEANLFHADDYFLQPYQRTEQRLNEAGGNMDRERFSGEILAGISSGGDFNYRPFDCSKQIISEPVFVRANPINIIEGAYSMHPEMKGNYDLKVFLKVSEETAKKRIEKRNSPEMQRRFFNEWIPMEQKYFKAFSIEENCDIIIINE